MKILYASDIHVSSGHLHNLLSAARKLEVDTIIVGGDLIPIREWVLSKAIAPQQNWVSDVLLPALRDFRKERPHVNVLLDFGNDDLLAARPLLEQAAGQGFELLHNKIVEISDDLAVVGYMNIPPTPFKLKDWEKPDCDDRTGLDGNIRRKGAKTDTGKEKAYRITLSKGTIQDDLQNLRKNMNASKWVNHSFIFVAHCPPLGSELDGMHNGQHVGSLAIRRFIEDGQASRKLHISLHGHIHESPDVSGKVYDNINGVMCFNMGQTEKQLQALMFDTEDIKGSAVKVVIADNSFTKSMIFKCNFQ